MRWWDRRQLRGVKRSRAAAMTTASEGRNRVSLLTYVKWTRIFQPNWKEIIYDEDFTRQDLRVLLFCVIEAVGQQNIIPFTQKQISLELGMTHQTVNRAFIKLNRKGIVFKQGHVYRLNSRIACALRSDELTVLRREEQQNFLNN